MNDQSRQPSSDPPKYWFPAKRYGWGWGLPITWQGWLTMAVFVLICAASSSIARGSLPITIAFVLLASILLLSLRIDGPTYQ